MSEPNTSTTTGSGQLRTLAVRISEELRAQLDIVAQLTGRSATEEIRLALEYWIEKTKADPSIQKKAEAVRTEIERNAQTQRAAIAAIFGGDDAAHQQRGGTTTTEDEAPASPRPASRRGKPTGE